MVIPPNIPLKKIKNLLDCFLKIFFCFITNGNNKKILRIFLKTLVLLQEQRWTKILLVQQVQKIINKKKLKELQDTFY